MHHASMVSLYISESSSTSALALAHKYACPLRCVYINYVYTAILSLTVLLEYIYKAWAIGFHYIVTGLRTVFVLLT